MTSPGKLVGAERAAPRSSDPELMARLARGDIGALGELYDRYQEPLRRFLVRATSDAEDVDDLLHNTFLVAAQSAARYDGRAKCRPWLVGIAVQLLRRRRRAVARFFDVLASLTALRDRAADPGPALHARRDIERGMARLSEAKRLTLLLADVEKLSGQEIAELLGVPSGTVWTRLHAARRELRQWLSAGGEP